MDRVTHCLVLSMLPRQRSLIADSSGYWHTDVVSRCPTGLTTSVSHCGVNSGCRLHQSHAQPCLIGSQASAGNATNTVFLFWASSVLNPFMFISVFLSFSRSVIDRAHNL